MRKLSKRSKRYAAKVPNWIRHVAASKVTKKGMAMWQKRRLGTFGAASEVRRIDPQTGEVLE